MKPKSIIISIILSVTFFLIFSPFLIKLTAYLHPIVLAVVFLCLFIVTLFIVLYIRKESISISFKVLRTGLIIYSIALIILLFFRPNDQTYNSINLIPFATVSFYLAGKVNFLVAFYNLAANIGLFIPYGIYFMLKKRRYEILILLPLLSIVSIELLQFVTNRGSLDIDDLILNMIGVFTGYLCFPLLKKIIIVNNISG
ncbi:VanZ family protein [Metabacillus fastidiosus]|uniref:VanZ family protein n=1 Tax=Metabacillus fastidiosus TaxID=1458 RepID=UPI002E22113E|nr:VanZ family protein [Metabacillus fastidiosus]